MPVIESCGADDATPRLNMERQISLNITASQALGLMALANIVETDGELGYLTDPIKSTLESIRGQLEQFLYD